jgi:hypothetical protein
LGEALAAHHGIDGGPAADFDFREGGFHKLKYLDDMHANHGDIDGTGDALGLLAEELLAEPIAEQAGSRGWWSVLTKEHGI